MVHKKSTYRLMYKNYAPEVRKTVWEENNSIRVKRRLEEMSHHAIQESDSDCACDDSDESLDPLPALRKSKSERNRSDEQVHLLQHEGNSGPAPHIPRLRFTPDPSPRESGPVYPCGDDDHLTREAVDPVGERDRQGSVPQLNLHQDQSDNESDDHQSRSRPTSHHLGVFRPRSSVREYDLIPSVPEECTAATRKASSTKATMTKSHKVPLTTKLSRTTRRQFLDRDKVNYVPCGTGASVRRIGDKTSFNVHLDRDQVRPTALQASSLRNREIERLIRKQKKMSLDDWREKRGGSPPYINHSSIWGTDSNRQLFSSTAKPRKRLNSAPSRVEVVSNYCKHCGGHK